MPTLKWIGKDKVINYHNEVPFRSLNERREYSVNGNETENLLIKGDNLEALKALLPYYYNRIKAIYIDPPYNTGNENWTYNDNVNSPEIRKWLGKVVGGEAEDLTRHDKWLCMMYPRLKLLRELLSEDGVFFVSIDDNEVHNLRMLMDEVFQPNNFIANLIWRKKKVRGRGAKLILPQTEYVYIYAKNISSLDVFSEPLTSEMLNEYNFEDEKSIYKLIPLAKSGTSQSPRPNLVYDITAPDGTKIPCPTHQWRWSRETLKREIEGDNVVFKKSNGKWKVFSKQRLYDEEGNQREKTPISYYDRYTTTDGTTTIKEIFGKVVFDFPKPYQMIRDFIVWTTSKEDIILDSFAGTGPTAHAVLALNKEDGGNRKFILVECEDSIAKDITAERLKRVIQGYSYEKSSGQEIKVERLGGGFKFLELGNPLFDKHKQIIGQPSYEDLAGYIYFTETHSTIDWGKASRGDWYVGENGGVNYFIIYGGKNELGEEFLQIAKCYQGKKVVYADAVMIDDDELERFDIIFKQIPYEIKTF